MYLIQYAFLVVLLHQCTVNGFNIFDIDFGLNYLNKETNAVMPPNSQDKDLKPKWFLQELDHFNSKDNRTWKQNYYEELRYFKEDGPIYVFLGALDFFLHLNNWATQGIMIDLAKETHGAFFLLVHRYYGDTKPFYDADAENMQYLSSKQALADTAKLIHNFKSLSMYKNSKVVVIGGGYAGNLAAWMKIQYPKLIDAAIASSAPILAKKDFSEYLEKVTKNYEHYGTKTCVDNIKEKFKKYETLLSSPEGIKQLKKEQNICHACDMTVKENQQLFLECETAIFKAISTYGWPDTYKKHCNNLNKENDYGSFINEQLKFVNMEKHEPCISYDFIDYLDFLRSDDYRYALMYQACTEFGHFPTTTSKKQIFFNIPLEFYIKICSGLFGSSFNEKRVDKGVEISNKLYGGLKPNVTNVVFTNGDLDPWSTISVLEDLSHDARAVVIPRGSHCRDLFSDGEEDSEELKEAKKHVKYLIKKWIATPQPVPVKYSDTYFN